MNRERKPGGLVGPFALELMSLRQGDLLLVRRRDPISQLIRWIDDRDPSNPVDVSHAAIVTSVGDDGVLVLSVWPMRRDIPGQGDVVIARVVDFLDVYDQVTVRRWIETGDAPDQVIPSVLSFLTNAQQRANRGELRFSNSRLVDVGLRAVRQFTSGTTRWLLDRALRHLDDEVAQSHGAGIICPDLIVGAFESAGVPLDFRKSEPSLVPATEDLAPAGDQGIHRDAAGVAGLPSLFEADLKRAAYVLACTAALDALIATPGAHQALLPPASASLGDSGVTPGDLVRSVSFETIGVFGAWRGRLPEVEIATKPGGRTTVPLERMWEPGVEPYDGSRVPADGS